MESGEFHVSPSVLGYLCHSPVGFTVLADGQPAEGDVHDGVPRRDQPVEQAERERHQEGVPVAATQRVWRFERDDLCYIEIRLLNIDGPCHVTHVHHVSCHSPCASDFQSQI